MKPLLITALLAIGIGPAFAQEATVYEPRIDNPRPRAEVRDEATLAVQAGARLSQGNYARLPAPSASAQRTRAEVRAEVIAAMMDGERLSYGEARRDPLPSRSQAATRLAARR